ncbi:MAG: carboxymuconolactone decarboxylase family protein, partial [Flavobacterium sp.]|nr:carboxymuconolactone decarboxylase family protein [Flavobacterium sp.]
MTRLKALNPEEATGKSKELFDVVKSKMGIIPNVTRTMANSTAVLGGYLGFSSALSSASIGTKLSELISLTVANENGCDYCNAAHTFVSGKIGLDPTAIEQARSGFSSEAKIYAALEFTKEILATKGNVSDLAIEKVKNAGYGDGQISEIIGVIALNVFTNYFNNVAQTEIDFPVLAPI